MNQSLSFSNRYLLVGVVALILLFLALSILAPALSSRDSGSTFNRAPEGYLGWYQYMEARGTPIERWQRPVEDLMTLEAAAPKTLLRVYPGIVSPYVAWSQDWVAGWLEAGNHLVVLGIDASIEAVPFRTVQVSPSGGVVIKTRRRHSLEDLEEYQQLGDEAGAVVWRSERYADPETTTPGQLYFAVTPHLAANAYQGAPGNYEFLANLVTQAGGTLWVDEYLHGYTEADVVVEAAINSWSTYLSRTPIKVAVIQMVILLGLFLLAQNRRLGNLSPVRSPQVDNSQAYIEALAAVLHKAKSTAFLVDMITKAERASLQRALGFNAARVDDTLLQQAWVQQTGQSAQAIMPLLQPPKRLTQQPDQTLNQWLAQIRQIRQTPIR